MTEPAALADYPKTVVLTDGTHLVLRPMVAADTEAVAALAARARAPRPPDGALRILALDGECVAGLLVLERRTPPGAALELVLDPAYGGRRLGTWMLLDAVHLAGALGAGRLVATVPVGADTFLAALRRLDFVEASATPGPPAGGARVLVKTLHAGWTDF